MHAFEFIEKPQIKARDPEPGRMLVNGDGLAWDGQLVWESLHGRARILRVAGKATIIYDAVDPDGLLIERLEPGIPESRIWRMANGDGYIHGKVTINDEAVVFEPLALPYPMPRHLTVSGSMGACLLASEEAIEEVQDDDFASDLYGALADCVWQNKEGKQFNGRWEKAGEILVAMRNKGEVPQDFFFEGNEGFLSTRVATLLDKLGWRIVGRLETAETRRSRALQLLNVCEKKPLGRSMPDWYAHWITGASGTDDETKRIHAAAFSGRVTFKEWTTFWELLESD